MPGMELNARHARHYRSGLSSSLCCARKTVARLQKAMRLTCERPLACIWMALHLHMHVQSQVTREAVAHGVWSSET